MSTNLSVICSKAVNLTKESSPFCFVSSPPQDTKTCARTMPSRMTLLLSIHLLRSSDTHSLQKQTGRSVEVTW